MIRDPDKFDDGMDKILLANGFKYYDDWEYGPQTGWSEDWEHVTIKLFRHDFGYRIIYSPSASGTHPTMGIGESNNAKDIIDLMDLLKKCRITSIVKE